MRHITILIAATILLVPTHAFACMNSIARHFATYPLDFAHFGIALASLVLLRWPLTLSSEGEDEPAELEQDELAAPSDLLEETIKPLYPSVVRQFTILAVFAVGGIGFGFFSAKVVEFEFTRLVGFAMVSVGLVAAAIGVSSTAGPTAGRLLRRLFLTAAFIASAIGANFAYEGKYQEAGSGFSQANEEVMHKINF